MDLEELMPIRHPKLTLCREHVFRAGESSMRYNVPTIIGKWSFLDMKSELDSNPLAGVGAGRPPELIEKSQVGLSCWSGSARLENR
jgi:hypothetical protein